MLNLCASGHGARLKFGFDVQPVGAVINSHLQQPVTASSLTVLRLLGLGRR
jgi:hypothetical protein